MGKSYKRKNKWYEDANERDSRSRQKKDKGYQRITKEDRLDEFIKDVESEAHK